MNNYIQLFQEKESLRNFLLGLTLLFAGWVGLIADLAAVFSLLTTEALLAVRAFTAFFTSLLPAILFNIWVGIALWMVGAREPWRAVQGI